MRTLNNYNNEPDGEIVKRAKAFCRKACRAMKQGDRTTARDLLLELDQQFPDQGKVCQCLSQTYLKFGDFDAAVRYGEKSTNLLPEDHESWLQLGYTQWSAGNQSEALSCLARAVELNPRSAEVWALSAYVKMTAQDNPNVGLGDARQAVECGPKNPHAWRCLSVCLEEYDPVESERAMARANELAANRNNLGGGPASWLEEDDDDGQTLGDFSRN